MARPTDEQIRLMEERLAAMRDGETDKAKVKKIEEYIKNINLHRGMIASGVMKSVGELHILFQKLVKEFPKLSDVWKE